MLKTFFAEDTIYNSMKKKKQFLSIRQNQDYDVSPHVHKRLRCYPLLDTLYISHSKNLKSIWQSINTNYL